MQPSYPSSPLIPSAHLYPSEVQILHRELRHGQDPYTAAQRISQIIKKQLHITRTVEEMQEQIIKILKKEGEQQPSSHPKNSEINLFKTFEDPKRNADISSTHFARPVVPTVPKRKNLLAFLSSRKIAKKQIAQSKSNWSLQERLDQLQRINQQCTYTYDKYDRKSNKKVSIKEQNGISPNIVGFYHQLFYSNYDRKYFDPHQMKQIYEYLGIKPSQSTYRNHKTILQALPKPKTFTDQFLSAEKLKLEQFRNFCRSNTKNLSKNNESTTDFPVHSIVLALHPMCGHLHTGSIMAYYKDNLYMVRFFKPELPAQKILDTNMSTQFTHLSNKILNRNNEMGLQNNRMSSANNNGTNNENTVAEIVDNINFQITGYLIKILAYKNELVSLMRIINDKIDKKQKQNIAPERKDEHSLRQIFQWIITVIAKLDILIKQALLRFRLRGVNQTNTAPIFNNLRNLLLNPLKLMSKEFENSNEQSDINAAEQIKEIINKQRENQIKKAINNAMMMNSNTNTNIGTKMENENENENEEQVNKNDTVRENRAEETKMMTLIHSCLGVLADLKYEGKGFDVQNNQYLIKLADISGRENSQAFNEVYERLFSIVTKVKE